MYKVQHSAIQPITAGISVISVSFSMLCYSIKAMEYVQKEASKGRTYLQMYIYISTDMYDKTLNFFRVLLDYIFRFLILLRGTNKILTELAFY
jgi:hypothetical protein